MSERCEEASHHSSGGEQFHVAGKASTEALIPNKCGRFAEQKGPCGWDHREKGIGTDFKVERPSGDKSDVGFLGLVNCLVFISGAYGQES